MDNNYSKFASKNVNPLVTKFYFKHTYTLCYLCTSQKILHTRNF